MKRHTQYRHLGALATAGLLTLASLPSAAHAEGRRTGNEPWYQQVTADARRQAQTLFAKALDEHQQLQRREAGALYDQALALWDNPDIRWNLALALQGQEKYLGAYRQLEGALRWGEALGAERLRDVRSWMQALETERLALIEVSVHETGTDITLDGEPWFRGAGQNSRVVEPGEHYIAARKAGFFPVIRAVHVKAGQAARVALPMDVDRTTETRQWSAWKPWAVAAAGVVVTAVGVGLERQAGVRRDAAASSFSGPCDKSRGCDPKLSPADYDRAVRDHRIAIAAFAVGGGALAAGLTMAWINQMQVHHTEARKPGPIEVTPILSTDQAGVSARLRF